MKNKNTKVFMVAGICLLLISSCKKVNCTPVKKPVVTKEVPVTPPTATINDTIPFFPLCGNDTMFNKPEPSSETFYIE
jgi:hypothetical protein